MDQAVTAQSATPKSLTILFADDEAIVRKAIGRTLEHLGHRVLLATDGNDAHRQLEELGDHPPDLLITDVDMPGCDGRDLVALVHERYATMKVIFTSGKTQPDLLSAARTDSQIRFLEKPFSRSDLIQCLEEFCGEA
ncbi:MAG: response regulator [Chthoniobacteraceae bacterium]